MLLIQELWRARPVKGLNNQTGPVGPTDSFLCLNDAPSRGAFVITEGELQKRRVKRNLSDSLRLSDEPGSSCFGACGLSLSEQISTCVSLRNASRRTRANHMKVRLTMAWAERCMSSACCAFDSISTCHLVLMSRSILTSVAFICWYAAGIKSVDAVRFGLGVADAR